MDVLEIPFVKKVGVTKTKNNKLKLAYTTDAQNHLKTLHASAQFSLAETTSGEFLQKHFPELVGEVIPVLRDANIKFKKPTVNNIMAHPSITNEAAEKFNTQLSKKGRASITVDVDIKDIEGTLTCYGSYNWFIQKIK